MRLVQVHQASGPMMHCGCGQAESDHYHCHPCVLLFMISIFVPWLLKLMFSPLVKRRISSYVVCVFNKLLLFFYYSISAAGTLTQNEMVFRRLHLGTVSYGTDTMDEIQSHIIQSYAQVSPWSQVPGPTSTSRSFTFFYLWVFKKVIFFPPLVEFLAS